MLNLLNKNLILGQCCLSVPHENIRKPLGVIHYVHKIFQKSNISTLLIRTRMRAYQGVRNVSFLENLPTYLMNGPLVFWCFRQLIYKVDQSNSFHMLGVLAFDRLISNTKLLTGLFYFYSIRKFTGCDKESNQGSLKK